MAQDRDSSNSSSSTESSVKAEESEAHLHTQTISDSPANIFGTEANGGSLQEQGPESSQAANFVSIAPQQHQPNPNAGLHIMHSGSDNGGAETDDHTSKKPRLRLAHACDRCRRRKIRCDTQQPCGPCKQTGTVCTFETPSRRMMKKRDRDETDIPAKASTSSGTHLPRPKTGRKGSSGAGSTKPANILPNPHTTSASVNSKNNYTSTLETRLNNLEALLRSIPPGVHNALISRLDGEMAVGPDEQNAFNNDVPGMAELLRASRNGLNNTLFGGNTNVPGAEDMDVGIPNMNGYELGADINQIIAQAGLDLNINLADLAGYNSATGLFDNANGSNGALGYNGLNVNALRNGNIGLGGYSTGLIQDNINQNINLDAGPSSHLNVVGPSANGFDIRNMLDPDADVMEGMERAMGGMNLSNGYLYVDEIGQTKWQGATSGFPLLDLLTAKPLNNEQDDIQTVDRNPDIIIGLHSPLEPTLTASSTTPKSTGSDDSAVAQPQSTSTAQEDEEHTGTKTGAREPSRKNGKKKEERFFPDRAPRPSQMLNPEATWRVITNVIPSDLMDTLVRCYLSTSHLLWPFLHVPSFLRDYADPQKWAEPGFACFVVAVCTLSSRHVDDPRVRAKADDPSTAGKQYFELFKRLRDLPSADRPTLYSIQAAFLAAIFAFGLGTLSKAMSLQAESVTLCLDGGLHRSVEGYDHFNCIEQEMRKRTFWSIYSWDKQSAALFGRPPIIHLRDCDVPEPLQIDDDYLTKEKILEQPPDHQTRLSAFVAVIRLHVVLEGVIDSCVTPSTFSGSSFLSKAAATISRRSQAVSLAEEEELLEEWVSILPKHWHYDVECVESKDPIRITQAERLHCLEHLVRMIVYRHRFSGFVQAPAETDDERARHLMYCRKAMDSALTICANHVHISQRGMMTYYGVHVIHQLAQAGRTLVAVVLNCKTPQFSSLIAPATEGLRSCVGLLRRFSGRYLCGLRSADIIEEFCRICHIPVETPRTATTDSRPPPAWLRPVQRRHSPSPAPTRRRRNIRNSSGQNIRRDDSGLMGPNPITRNVPDLNSFFTDGLDNPASANALLSTQDFFDLSAATSPAQADGNLQQPRNDIFDSLGPASAPFDQFESLEPDTVMADAGTDGPVDAWDVPFAPGNDVLGNMSASTILNLMRQGTFSQSWS